VIGELGFHCWRGPQGLMHTAEVVTHVIPVWHIERKYLLIRSDTSIIKSALSPPLIRRPIIWHLNLQLTCAAM